MEPQYKPYIRWGFEARTLTTRTSICRTEEITRNRKTPRSTRRLNKSSQLHLGVDIEVPGLMVLYHIREGGDAYRIVRCNTWHSIRFQLKV